MTVLAGGGWHADVDAGSATLSGLRHRDRDLDVSTRLLTPWPAETAPEHAWQVAVTGEDWTTLGCRLHDAGRPTGLAVQLSYSLGDDGLTVLVETFNVGEAPVPHGCAVAVHVPGASVPETASETASDAVPRDERARASVVVGGAEVWWGPSLPWVRLAGVEGGTEVRPASCPDDAVTSGEDVVRLLPGHAHVVSCGVRLAPT